MTRPHNVRLLILIPTPGHVVTAFFQSMIGLTQSLARAHIPFAVKTHAFSDIVMSRNYLMSFFLSQTDFTHALCLDSDLEFQPAQFFRLLDLGVDAALAPYPRRKLSTQKLAEAFAQNAALPAQDQLRPDQVMARACGHVVQLTSSDRDWQSRKDGDFITVPAAGMGFLLISRNVPEMIVAKELVRAFPEQGRLPLYADAPEFYGFFNHRISADDKYILGEDQSFMHHWVFGCQQDLWADTKARLVHYGDYGFQGDFEAQFR
jgi:hypothetical protein